MNTRELQKNFPKLYEEFFGECQKIVSAPHSFFWTGDFSGLYGGLTISSKIPLRFYVGLQEIEADKFELENEFTAYSPNKNDFVRIRLDGYIVEALEKILAPKLKGFRVKFFSEVILGLSLGGLGCLSACLAQLIYPQADDGKKFELANQIAAQIQRGRPSGATTFAALTDSAYPVVFYSKGRKWWGKSLDVLFDLPKNPVWPVDFGLIFSGNLVQGSSVIASSEEVKQITKAREKKLFKISGYNPGSFWNAYIAMLDQVASQSLIAIGDLFQKGANDGALRFFFDTLNQYQNLFHFLGISTVNIDRIYSAVHKIASRQENNVGSGAKITGVGKGGEVLFAVGFGQYREKIEKISRGDFSLDYASWRDGFESRGLVLEQDISVGVFGNFVKSGSSILKIYKGEKISTKIGAEKADLLLDLDSGKIMYKGKKIDSNQLSSQKATVKILSDLLNSDDWELKNTQLDKSYGQSRFDLQSKISAPLSKLAGLRFEISGGAYDNFSLKLKPFSISIGVVKKIN